MQTSFKLTILAVSTAFLMACGIEGGGSDKYAGLTKSKDQASYEAALTKLQQKASLDKEALRKCTKSCEGEFVFSSDLVMSQGSTKFKGDK